MGRQLKEYRLMDGTVVGGYDSSEIVESMASYKLATPRSRESYRKATAKRCSEMYRVEIDPTTDSTFVQSMVQAELLISC